MTDRERLLLINEVFHTLYLCTSSFNGAVGRDLTYLFRAISHLGSSTGDHEIVISRKSKLAKLLHNHFNTTHNVWKFVGFYD